MKLLILLGKVRLQEYIVIFLVIKCLMYTFVLEYKKLKNKIYLLNNLNKKSKKKSNFKIKYYKNLIKYIILCYKHKY